jgi:hypothetical protein
MVLVARLPELTDVEYWAVPSPGAHGIDIDHEAHRLYVACDEGSLVEIDTISGKTHNQWPLAGGPDATFFNPDSGWVHVAIAEPGLIQSINPRTGACTQLTTVAGAKTTALVPPDRLYVFSAPGGGILDLAGA